jgi:putative Mg2+ transporter-C (MgtC) family protein
MEMAAELRLLGTALYAALLGGLIGLEREWRGSEAGLRTHIAAALACCAFVQLGQIVLELYKRHGGRNCR